MSGKPHHHPRSDAHNDPLDKLGHTRGHPPHGVQQGVASHSAVSASPEWQALAAHQRSQRGTHMRDLFAADPQRAQRHAIEAGPLFIDYSKHRITDETLTLLQRLAQARDVAGWRARMLAGEAINTSESRAALHVALRGSGPALAQAEARAALEHMRTLSAAIRSGAWKGVTGKPFTDIIHIGIGGSDLGPRLAVQALAAPLAPGNAPRTYFAANIDPHELDDALRLCDPASTLVIVISKSFSTAETLLNARHARDWLRAGLGADVGAHLTAVTNNTAAAAQFGVAADQILSMPEWAGGRFSLWSTAGLSILLTLGSETFDALLAGAAEIDRHFIETPFERNAPVLMALLSVWYGNFWDAQIHAVLPYSKRLELLPDYLQQLEMESNGKRIDRQGKPVTHATAPVIFGGTGANSQHSFHQLFHQGTHLVPSDFVVTAPTGDARSRMLAVNAVAQTAALMSGDADDPVGTPGNQPSTTILLPALNPRTLGALLALYEHKVFVEGVLWNINSFDQPGVELGKRIATALLPSPGAASPPAMDSSTRALMHRLGGT